VADAGILVDMIVQSCDHPEGEANLSFTVPRKELKASVEVAEKLSDSFDWRGVTSSPSVGKLTVTGIGLRSHTDVATRMFRALADAGVNVAMINTSEVQVNVVVDGKDGEKALKHLTSAFADVMR
jgi:aspartate kinase